MADVDAPSAADGTQKARPEKPDEAKYKAELAKAEKDHEAAQARFVRLSPLMLRHDPTDDV